MDILDFYLNQQKYKDWYIKFQSTGENKSGKIFSYINTNYRFIESFFTQFIKFEKNNGIERSSWSKYESGQEEDKHRVVNLINAGIFSVNIDKYFLTNIGYTCKDLIDADNLLDCEKWILLYILLLNYKCDGKYNDIVVTSKEFMSYLFMCGLKEEDLLPEMKKAMNVSSLQKLFEMDIFWYITFAKDKQFVEKYKSSTEHEKELLHGYLIREQKNKKSKDCIGHKYVGGGAYNKHMFTDELSVLYYSYIVSKKEYNTFDEFIDMIVDLFVENNIVAKKDNIIDFINQHKSVYEYIYNQFKF